MTSNFHVQKMIFDSICLNITAEIAAIHGQGGRILSRKLTLVGPSKLSQVLSLRSVQGSAGMAVIQICVHMIPHVWVCIVSKLLMQVKQAEVSQHAYQVLSKWSMLSPWKFKRSYTIRYCMYIYIYIYSYIWFEVHWCSFHLIFIKVVMTSPEHVTCLTRSAASQVLRAWPKRPTCRFELQRMCPKTVSPKRLS